MSFAPMIIPSTESTIVFVAVVVAVAVMIVAGSRAAGRRRGEPPEQVRRWTLGTLVGVLAWMALTGAASGSGVLEAPGVPPRAMIFMLGCNLVALVFAFGRPGRRLAEGLPVAALVGFHAFRLPLELVLHQWYAEGVLPVQMTYEGRNFDIATGVLAVACGLWLHRAGPSRAVGWVFNLVGLALVLNVAAVAVLSSPFPIRVFTNEPAVVLVYHFPYGWIVPMCVAPALAGHVVLFRWLWHGPRSSD